MKHQSAWQFKPPLWAWLLTLATVSLFVFLSVWQTERAAEKRESLALYERTAEPRRVTAVSDLESLPRYAPVVLEGQLWGERQFLLDNMLRDGRPGFHVWTPLRLADDGGLVIVDRGWVKEAGEFSPPAGPVRVRGRVDRLPEPGFRLAAPDPEGEWPRRIYFPRVAELESQLGERVFDGRILMASEQPDSIPGFRRDWEPVNMPPERHIGYAFQWAALAAAVFVVFLVVNFKRVRNDE